MPQHFQFTRLRTSTVLCERSPGKDNRNERLSRNPNFVSPEKRRCAAPFAWASFDSSALGAGTEITLKSKGSSEKCQEHVRLSPAATSRSDAIKQK